MTNPLITEALRLAQNALNTAPRFKVGDTDSYQIATRVDQALTLPPDDPAQMLLIEMLGAAMSLDQQIRGLAGESSVIDEDLETGAPLLRLRIAIAKATSTSHSQQAAPEDEQDWITIRWHFDDVKEVRPDLTDDQARQVLQRALHCHDCNYGISWETLQAVADIMFPEPVA